MKEFYRRHLPHLQPVAGTFFVTFRLHGSLPQVLLQQLRKDYNEQAQALACHPFPERKDVLLCLRKRQFAQYDQGLDRMQAGPCFLREVPYAQLVSNEIFRLNGKLYDLLAYCIMPNHVHLLIDTALQLPEDIDFYAWETIAYKPLQDILKQIKGASARFLNLALGRTGQCWQHESYDHLVRSDRELENIVAYILNNPVKARLPDTYCSMPFSFCKWSQ